MRALWKKRASVHLYLMLFLAFVMVPRLTSFVSSADASRRPGNKVIRYGEALRDFEA